MGFGDKDLDEMFAAAASAAEDTGEKGMEKYNDNPTATKEPVKTEVKAQSKPEVKVEPKPEVKVEPKPEVKVEPAKTVEPARKAEPARKVEEPVAIAPVPKERTLGGITNTSKGLTEESIGRILDMNNTFDKFDGNQKNFVSSYFQLDEGDNDASKVIYRALIASQRDLDALSKIVIARDHTPAERAFFLMGLDNYSIQDIYEQVDILSGPLNEAGNVSDNNKLKVCRKIESVIAEMDKDVFSYIERLQQFTDKAVPK